MSDNIEEKFLEQVAKWYYWNSCAGLINASWEQIHEPVRAGWVHRATKDWDTFRLACPSVVVGGADDGLLDIDFCVNEFSGRLSTRWPYRHMHPEDVKGSAQGLLRIFRNAASDMKCCLVVAR